MESTETEGDKFDKDNQPQPAPPQAARGAHTGNQRAPVRTVNWSERLATENIPAFTENTGQVNVLGSDKQGVDVFYLLFQLDY